MAKNKPDGASQKPDGVDWARAQLGRSMRCARLKAGLSRADLARKLRKSESTIAGAETGKASVSVRYVQAVMKACGQDQPDEERAVLSSEKRKRLAKLGGRVTTVKEFLGLSDAEMAVIERRLRERERK